jgi:RHS repeat-associated protein
LNYTNKYVYNLVGNRLWQTNVSSVGMTVTAYTYNDNDQLLQEVTTGSGSGTFTNKYDANGALTTAIVNRTDGGHQLAETINYTYDYKGNRVRAQWVRSVDGGANVNGTNIFLNQENQIFEELPAIGATPTVSYTLGGHTQSKGGTISHILSDGHGSTRQLADTTGSITAKYNYDAYGKGFDFTNGTQSPTATELLYSGGQLDPDLQLYHLGPRYYNTANGRFNQIDPYSVNQQSGANLYAYGADDPVNNSDPSGLYDIDVHQYLTAYLAEQAGFDPGRAAGIGAAAQGPDAVVNPDGTLNQSRSAYHDGHADHKNFPLYHFVSRDQLFDLASHASVQDMRALGEFFHAQEDTYAHSSKQGGRDFHYYGDWFWGQNGGKTGHGLYASRPDWTWADQNKAMLMAQRVFRDLRLINSDPNRKYPVATEFPYDEAVPDSNWDRIKGQVEKFVKFTPNVTYAGWYSFATVTYGGYNKKIQILDNSYKIDPAYTKGNNPLYPDVTGSQPGHHEMVKGATQLMIHTSDFDTGLNGLGGIAAC